MIVDKKTFCTAPWYSVFTESTGHIAPCCRFKEQKYKFADLDEYFNSALIKSVRHDLINGVKNANCTACWKDEENGGDSQRLISNRTMALHGKMDLNKQINDPKVENIKSFDLTLGNLCNLKCVMCSPRLSSQLLAEANLNPEIKTRYDREQDQELKQKDFDWPKGNDFVEWCKQYLPQAIHVKFTGGEPFMIPWIYDAIESIPDDQKARCVLHFTTNLTILNEKLFDSFRKFKEVWISVSVEGANQTFEYLRYGHKWNTLTNNIRNILDKQLENLILKINHVVQTPSYHSIQEMTRFFDDLELEIHPILLTSPELYHISALSEKSKQKFLDDTESYNGYNKNFINFVRSVTQEYKKQNATLTKKCIQDLKNLDRVRKNSHKDVIPLENISI